jgi:hypothetical protein
MATVVPPESSLTAAVLRTAEWLGLKRAQCAFTCPGGGDGMGAQVFARLSTRIFARHYGYQYLHTPLQKLDHTPPSMAATEWAAQWEHFLNYAEGETLVPPNADGVIPVKKVQRLRPLSHRIYAVKNCHDITNRLPAEWHALRPQLRAAYQRTAKPDLGPGESDHPVLAVHIRRGDVSSDGLHHVRFTALDDILARVEFLSAVLHTQAGNMPSVHVYSEGDAAAFQPLVQKFAASLHLDEDAFTSFHSLVQADGLVMAKSSFSYLAGLLSTGLCVYEPFWHPPMPDWKTA